MFIRTLCTILLVAALPLQAARGQKAQGMDPSLTVTQYARDVWSSKDGLPQASISSIIQTGNGYLWFGTQEGLVRFDGIKFRVFSNFNESPFKNTVSALYGDGTGSIWVGTRGGGLSYYRDEQFHTISDDDLSDDVISSITGTNDGDIWLATNRGVNRIHGDSVSAYRTEEGLPSINVATVVTDKDGVVWAGTSLGLAYFDGSRFTTDNLPSELAVDVTALMESENGTMWIGTRSDGLYVLRNGAATQPYRRGDLPDGTVRALLEDASGSVWVGFDKSGIARIYNQRIEVLDTDNGLSDRNIRALIEDREGSIWVGTDGGGLIRLRTGRFVNYTLTEGLLDDEILGVYADGQNQVWAGTEEGGATRIAGGRTRTFTKRDGLPSNHVISISGTADGSIWFGTDAGLARLRDGKMTVVDSIVGIANAGIYALFTDSRDGLWIAGSDALFRYDGERFERYDESIGLSSTVVTVIAEDNMGDIWVGTYNAGLNRMRNGKVISVFDDSSGLLSQTVTALHPDRDGVMWVGLRDGGLSRIDIDGSISTVTRQHGLFDSSVHHIVADDEGSLWMTSNRGLFAVEIRQLEEVAANTRSTITSRAFGRSDGLITDEFNSGFQPAGARTVDGRMWFPSQAGVVSINPRDLRLNEVAPTVVIDSVSVDGGRIADGAIVPPGRRRLDIAYVGLSFIAPERTRYQYLLSGVDEGWRDAGNATTASYTNLKPGSYMFRVRAANADGAWSSEASFQFELRPYLYETPGFAVAVVVLLLLVISLLHRLRVQRLKQQHRELEKLVAERTHDLQVEKDRTEEALLATEHARRDVERQKEIAERAREVIEEQADRLREMDRIKSRFFGNISHEFRTPLTLTIGPLENAITGVYGDVSPKLARQLDIMLRNSRRLLRLINQLLDLSKLESGQFHLKPRRGNLTALVEGVVLSFSAFTEMENINLEFRSEGVSGKMYFDVDATEKVFFNLLSNAVKFTPNGGGIDVTVSNGSYQVAGVEQDVAIVRITDSGVGIPAAQLPHVFDRFHQVDGTVSRVQEGTGIGLALVKELVQLHGGEITVESVVGKGTTFTVYLRKDADHFEVVDESDPVDDTETSHGPMVEMAVFEDQQPGGDGAVADAAPLSGTDRPCVLVVDDSQDIRQYIVECLSGMYRVVTATDGMDAIERVRSEQPDMIVSDVMMPRMDGYALCRAIKGDPEYQHIPIVLLTSKASVEARIEGLEAGSDDYLAKPFNARELRTRIGNLLNLRKQSAELRELNKALVANNDALREASELKSQLLNIASHDMKNPLTAIREFARIVKDELGADSHLNELLDLIYSSSNEMLQLVTQLLDSAALEGGQLKLDRRPVDMVQLADVVVHRNRAQAKAKGQRIVYDKSAAEDALVMADFNRMQEAMDNILSNAIKYSPPEKSIYLSLARRDGSVEFRVRDEGPGLTDDDKARLFGKFQKLSAQPTGGESSTGLGLSIVKQIVDLHGGSVWAESKPGSGATFVIELAAIEDDAVPVSSARKSAE